MVGVVMGAAGVPPIAAGSCAFQADFSGAPGHLGMLGNRRRDTAQGR